jgi:tetratricopeptide (TPR) repeat protein
VYIVLSIAYRRVDEIANSIRTVIHCLIILQLSRCVIKYPKYTEAYLARGQLFIFEKKWEKALSDFKSVISLLPTSGIGLNNGHNTLGYIG